MTAHDVDHSYIPPTADDFVRAVLSCQESYWDWADATDEQAKQLQRRIHSEHVEHLFTLLKLDLAKLTHKWTNSSLGQDQDSLIGSAFNCIYQALQTLRIDPQKNLRRCLLTIADRGLTDRYWEDSALRRKRVKHTTPQDSLVEPTSSNDYQTNQNRELKIYSLERIAQDVYALTGSEEVWVNRMHGTMCMQEILRFWSETLSHVEQVIIQMRWGQYPQASYKEIALRLGPGWTDVNARKYNERIIRKTRTFLYNKGLFDDNSDNNI